MRILFAAFVCLILFLSCSKSSDQLPPPDQPQLFRSGWTKFQLPDSSEIFDIAFATLARGYIAVKDKGIYQSLDSGKTWNIIPSSLGKKLLTIRFLNSQYGYSIGLETNAQSYGYTSDGGNTWNFKTPPPGGGWDIQFLSPSLGYVAGQNGLYKTIDTGNTWTLLKSGKFSSLHFLDEQNGWATTGSLPNQIYSTTNGGAVWNLKFESNFELFQTIQFINSNIGYATSSTKMVKTVNGGSTWQISNTGQNATDIEFLNSTLGYRTEWDKIIKSTDGGQTWAIQVDLRGGIIWELVFLDPDHGWAAGSNGTILRYSKL